MEHFSFSRYCFVVRAKSDLYLPPFKGSTLRGGFGHVFRKIVCVNKDEECNHCFLHEKCIYARVFESRPPSRHFVRKYSAAPRPFILCPPLTKKTHYQPGDTLNFELTLIGQSTDYLPYFIYAFIELGKRGIGREKGKYELIELRHKALDGVETVIYTGHDQTLKSIPQVITWNDIIKNGIPPPPTLTLLFLTPLRVKERGDLVVNLTFPTLIARLMERIDVLSYFYCGGSAPEENQALLKEAQNIKAKAKSLRWYDWERYSNRQKRRMKMGGLIGAITFSGNLAPFMPYLLLGQYIHVGQGTTFGLGRYEIVRRE